MTMLMEGLFLLVATDPHNVAPPVDRNQSLSSVAICDRLHLLNCFQSIFMFRTQESETMAYAYLVGKQAVSLMQRFHMWSHTKVTLTNILLVSIKALHKILYLLSDFWKHSGLFESSTLLL